ncbi:DUF2971 domain-containing protein [Grimontia hollisae]|uniref:Protein of uncharacterized function (DUF2971) n=1 Tax=Grimontia hollisae TaxID=673 RepID=A0A377HLZ9_GRIHO|nr:DUF2971 domain-containing protein [Grimontia hollisae]STO56732.1 Protein of uncharacterised function (DUF2971) [Grimontia hollisae]
MAVARSIFKYREFTKSSIELLVNQELWFARPDTLNDPFECQMMMPEMLESIWRHHEVEQKEREKISQFLTKSLDNVGICSFSKTRQNQLMWAHYADEHKGFCIGFSKKALMQDIHPVHCENVEYQKDLPYKGVIERIKYFENRPLSEIPFHNSSYSIASDILSSSIGIKYTNWSYEKEVRLVKTKFGAYKFHPSSVVSIAFGLRMSEGNKATLRKLLSGPEWSHVLWFQAQKMPDKFGLEFLKI